MESLRFLSSSDAATVRDRFGTPTFVYDAPTLMQQARQALAFPSAFGLTVRFAMKASPNATLLKLFRELGLHIDASSGYEVERAIRAGFAPDQISLSSQELPADIGKLLDRGVKVNACSLNQLTAIARQRPGVAIGLRFNPGKGSGGNDKTNVGGPSSSFGIWHASADRARRIAADADLTVERIHTHIGSGSDPAVWQEVANLSLGLFGQFPDATTLNLGGGYKVGRMSSEGSTDLQAIGGPVADVFRAFAERTDRQPHLEIEPGTYLVANAASLVATVADVVDTGPDGHTFYKLDTGMTEVLRPSLYGSQHPVVVLPANPTGETRPAVVVGHCCESGDLITPLPNEPDALGPRTLPVAQPGDLAVVEGVGAYCSAMSAKNYNSFPEAAEVLRCGPGILHLIRKRQTLDQILANEVDPAE
ncbi:MAG: diaminopimelate decarboxylase [Opitutales bacterium]